MRNSLNKFLQAFGLTPNFSNTLIIIELAKMFTAVYLLSYAHKVPEYRV